MIQLTIRRFAIIIWIFLKSFSRSFHSPSLVAVPFKSSNNISGESVFRSVEIGTNEEISQKSKPHHTIGISRKSQYNPMKRLLRSENRNLKQKDDTIQFGSQNESFESIDFTIQNARDYASKGQAEMALNIFLSIASTDHITLKDCNQLLKELGNSGHLDHCAKILSKMVEVGIEPSLVTYSTLISRAGAWKKKSLAQKYYNMMLKSNIQPDVQAYNSLINAYSKSSDSDMALQIFHEMEKAGVKASLITFNTLLDACARQGRITRAQELFQQMISRGMVPNFRSYSSLIHAHCQIGQLPEALQIFHHMESSNIPPTSVTYSMLLHGLGQSGELYRAFRLLESMKSKGLRPNVVTMTSLVHSCARNGQLDLAFQLYEEMSTSSNPEDRPNSITCSSLVDACLKQGFIDRAFQVIRDMRRWGVALTEVTYTSLITELTKMSALDRIVDVIQGEPEQGIPPTVRLPNGNAFFPTSAKSITVPRTHSPRSSPLYSNNNDDSTSSSSESRASSSPWFSSMPNISPEVSKQLVRLLSSAERVDAALDVLEGMVRSRALPPRETVELVVAAVEGAKELDRAAELVHKVTQLLRDSPQRHAKSVERYREACLLLLRASSRADGLLKAYEVFAEVAEGPGEDNAYAALMDACREGSNHQAVLNLFESMKDDGVTPGPKVYHTLMRSMYEDITRRSRETTKSKQMPADELFRLYLVFQEMKIAGVEADAPAYNTLINACAAAGDFERAIETVRAMQEEGIAPDVITYTSLIKACAINGGPKMTEIAEEIFEAMQQRTNHFSTYIEPTQLTYKRLLQVYITSDHLESKLPRVLELLEDMEDKDSETILQSCRTCIKTAVRIGNINLALRFVDLIRKYTKHGFDMKSWQLLATACSHNDYQDVGNVFRKELTDRRANFVQLTGNNDFESPC